MFPGVSHLSFYCIAIPVPTIFDDALLCWIVDVDDAEAFGIAEGPFEIVHEGPDKIAFQRGALAHRAVRLVKVLAQVMHTAWIMYMAIFAQGIRKSRAVLSNVEGGNLVFFVKARQKVI